MQRLDSMKFLLLGLCLHIKKLAQLNGWLTFFNYNKQCILIIRVSNVIHFSPIKLTEYAKECSQFKYAIPLAKGA